MPESPVDVRDISTRLFKANAIKFGDFVVGTGATTPVYFDFRVIVSYPDLMRDLSIVIGIKINQIIKQGPRKTVICGIPYSAVPITALVSQHTDLPMVMKRKEVKEYGTKQLVEGVWNKGDTCILVDDVIMFGDSIIETVEELRETGFECTDVVVVCDREQGAIAKVAAKGIRVHALLTLTEIMEHLFDEEYITQETFDMVRKYLAANQVAR
ncbi:uridine 5'-monophosphate synthase-like [Anthonomus grandis grandis]|uniref:uridine 5'-monophosphate synthase-like n=1 Tax=Anthonomus grandis grandis TaxID=2921223 RepID=UPI002166486B|nr:uridine 5'-monophosphate synthase-like [Anthonomus grandis grandis]